SAKPIGSKRGSLQKPIVPVLSVPAKIRSQDNRTGNHFMAPRLGKDFWIYRRLLIQARPYWPHILALAFLSLLASSLSLLAPVPVKLVVDSVLGSKPLPGWLAAVVSQSLAASTSGRLTVAILVFIVTAAFSQLRGLVAGLLETYTGERLVLAFRTELFRQVQRLSLAY